MQRSLLIHPLGVNIRAFGQQPLNNVFFPTGCCQKQHRIPLVVSGVNIRTFGQQRFNFCLVSRFKQETVIGRIGADS